MSGQMVIRTDLASMVLLLVPSGCGRNFTSSTDVIRNILGFLNYSFSAQKNRFASCSPKARRKK